MNKKQLSKVGVVLLAMTVLGTGCKKKNKGIRGGDNADVVEEENNKEAETKEEPKVDEEKQAKAEEDAKSEYEDEATFNKDNPDTSEEIPLEPEKKPITAEQFKQYFANDHTQWEKYATEAKVAPVPTLLVLGNDTREDFLANARNLRGIKEQLAGQFVVKIVPVEDMATHKGANYFGLEKDGSMLIIDNTTGLPLQASEEQLTYLKGKGIDCDVTVKPENNFRVFKLNSVPTPKNLENIYKVLINPNPAGVVAQPVPGTEQPAQGIEQPAQQPAQGQPVQGQQPTQGQPVRGQQPVAQPGQVQQQPAQQPAQPVQQQPAQGQTQPVQDVNNTGDSW